MIVLAKIIGKLVEGKNDSFGKNTVKKKNFNCTDFYFVYFFFFYFFC